MDRLPRTEQRWAIRITVTLVHEWWMNRVCSEEALSNSRRCSPKRLYLRTCSRYELASRARISWLFRSFHRGCSRSRHFVLYTCEQRRVEVRGRVTFDFPTRKSPHATRSYENSKQSRLNTMETITRLEIMVNRWQSETTANKGYFWKWRMYLESLKYFSTSWKGIQFFSGEKVWFCWVFLQVK